MESKIKTLEELKEILDKIRDEKVIVTTNGSFDLLHAGHLHSLEKAKSFGDVLVVCLNSDSSIKQYKSPDRPIVPENERAKMMAALECVDYVLIFEHTTPCNILSTIKPHKHIKSKSGFTGVEREAVESNGGEIILIDDVPGFSTTNIIDKIKKINSS